MVFVHHIIGEYDVTVEKYVTLTCVCFDILLFISVLGWAKKQKCLSLTCCTVVGVLWLIFRYKHTHLTVSEKSLQYRLRAGHDDTSHGVLLHGQFGVKNISFKSVLNMNDRVEVIPQTNVFLTTHIPAALQIVPDDSRIPFTELEMDDIEPHKNWISRVSTLMPKKLRAGSRQWQTPSGQQVSRISFEYRFTKSNNRSLLLKSTIAPLLASGHKSSGSFEFDVQHSVDRRKRIVISIIDSGYVNFAINFQRVSVNGVGLRNFLFVCTDRQAVIVLRQHGIACSYFHKVTAVQVAV